MRRTKQFLMKLTRLLALLLVAKFAAGCAGMMGGAGTGSRPSQRVLAGMSVASSDVPSLTREEIAFINHAGIGVIPNDVADPVRGDWVAHQRRLIELEKYQLSLTEVTENRNYPSTIHAMARAVIAEGIGFDPQQSKILKGGVAEALDKYLLELRTLNAGLNGMLPLAHKADFAEAECIDPTPPPGSARAKTTAVILREFTEQTDLSEKLVKSISQQGFALQSREYIAAYRQFTLDKESLEAAKEQHELCLAEAQRAARALREQRGWVEQYKHSADAAKSLVIQRWGMMKVQIQTLDGAIQSWNGQNK